MKTRPEIEILLCCARTYMDPDNCRRLESALRKQIDWEYLVQRAHTHGLVPLLYRNLHATCPEAVPKAVLGQLERRFYVNDLKNNFLTRELLRLLHLLKSNGIPAIPYKGPALAVAAYGNVAYRQFGDLDMLIHKQDLTRTKELLISEGYQLQLTSEREEASLKYHYHYHFVRNDSRVHVEIHWAFTRTYWSFPIDYQRLWSRLQPVALNGAHVSSFHPEDLLLILCAHAAKHYWERLAWICDVAELIRAHPKLEWEQITRQANEVRSGRILLLGLFLASDLLGAVLPEQVLARVRADPEVEWLGTQVREWLFTANSQPGPAFQRHRFYFRMRERWQDKGSFVCHLIPIYLCQAITLNEKDRAFLTLPDSLSFCYYLLRPVRLIKEHVFMPLKLLFNRFRTAIVS